MIMMILMMITIIVIIIAIMINMIEIILIIAVVIINSPFRPGDFSTGSTADKILGKYTTESWTLPTKVILNKVNIFDVKE